MRAGLRTRNAPTSFLQPKMAWASFRILNFTRMRAQQQPAWLATARLLGDYLVKEVLTPDTGRYPAFTRSTGRRAQFPQPADCGSQSDRPYEIQPDKGGIAGYCADAAVRSDRRGAVSGAGAAERARAGREPARRRRPPFALAVSRGLSQRRRPRADIRKHDAIFCASTTCWQRMAIGNSRRRGRRCGIGSRTTKSRAPPADGALFAQFFEDHDTPTNRSAWGPLNLARYLLEKKGLARIRTGRATAAC